MNSLSLSSNHNTKSIFIDTTLKIDKQRYYLPELFISYSMLIRTILIIMNKLAMAKDQRGLVSSPSISIIIDEFLSL